MHGCYHIPACRGRDVSEYEWKGLAAFCIVFSICISLSFVSIKSS